MARSSVSGKKTKSFTINKAIIRHLIHSQAGTLAKSFEELLSNSIDAKATKIELKLEQGSFSLSDNGVGFTSEEEVDKLFADFGFDHTTEDQLARGRKIGQFGMGRGQIFSFAKTKWTSNEFQMDVDLEDRESEAAFDFEALDETMHKGCLIEGEFYNQQTLMDLNHTIQSVSEHLAYITGCEITINGKVINKNPKDLYKKWDVDSDDFYFKVGNNAQGVKVYNQGVYVETIPNHRYGISGVLISKQNLKLNMARNSWLEPECQYFKIAKKFLMSMGENRANRKKSLTIEDRIFMIRQMLSAEDSFTKYYDMKIIQAVNGKYYSLRQVQNYPALTVSPKSSSQLGENLIRDNIAFVMSPNCLGWFGVHSIHDLMEKFKTLFELVKHDNRQRWNLESFIKDVKTREFDDFVNLYNGNYMIISKSDHSKEEVIALASLRSKLIDPIRIAVLRSSNLSYEELGTRTIKLGESDIADAWTDGKNYIVLERKFLTKSFNSGVIGIEGLVKTILHEYCHTESSGEEHAHGLEFKDRFHDAMFKLAAGPLTLALAKEYYDRREKAELPLKATLTNSIDKSDRIINELPTEIIEQSVLAFS